ncbi:3-hydroxyacyl-CoA dehydrogenase family protein [Blastococcus sp. SYSU D00669]
MTRVGVCGAGTMGSGIAIVAAQAGHEVVLYDADPAAAERGRETVGSFLDRGVALGKLTPERRDAALDGLVATGAIGDLAPCEVVVEAVVEDVGAKARLFGELDGICDPTTLFHTNTSTLSVTAIAAGSARPERVIGTHYCNPAPLMKLVEIVKARQTSEETYERTAKFLAEVNKVVVTTADTPGFIVNRFLIPFENDCIRALAAGRGTVDSIDTAVTRGLRYPMGPFALLDIVGLDIHHAVSTSLYEQLRDPKFAPPPLVSQMIAAGHLGRKTGRGFRTYDDARLFGS